ncbi:MAG: pantoate--beta-alanine ligase [Armatimonadetes bacterium]|nr:pantoate--beta-alanine ligase [Armatimonadota bacterium]
MQTVSFIGDVREVVENARAAGRRIGFVPTMGALHAGHAALIRQAHEEGCFVIVSVFVNPAQFNDAGDLAAYPRTLTADEAVCREAGADLVFAPEVSEIYPAGFATQVTVDSPLTKAWEGHFRPGHFAGVTTVVAKLLLIAQCDRAFFGEKDWQQLAVVRQMVRDLAMGVAIVGSPTVRESDGLAMSSRNVRLSPEARKTAKIIPYLLDTAQDLLDSATPETQTDKGGVIAAWLRTLLESNAPDARLDYLAVVDPDTLVEVDEITNYAQVIIAVHIGGVRLIDNRKIVKRF